MKITTEAMATSELLHPRNHALFDHIRMMLVARNPVITWEEIATEFGFDDPKPLIDWFLAYKLPVAPKMISTVGTLPRSPELRLELSRLRQREASLITVATESPLQLDVIQSRIRRLERAR